MKLEIREIQIFKIANRKTNLVLVGPEWNIGSSERIVDEEETYSALNYAFVRYETYCNLKSSYKFSIF